MNQKQAALLSFLSKAANGGAEMPSQLLDDFSKSARDALEKHFSPREEGFRLRMSNVGKPLCQLQMEASGQEAEGYSYDFKMRVIMGDLMEALLITLMQASGIEIKSKHKQVELDVDGTEVRGEFDVELDDGIYDIKTASPYAFEHKFNSDNAFDSMKKSDSFGYIPQGYGYGMAAGVPFKGWIALNKSTGEIAFAEVPEGEQYKYEAKAKISDTVNAIGNNKPFKRCFDDYEEMFYKKPTGNRVLGIECSYCPFKKKCWDNLQHKKQLPSKGRNPRWVWYTHISEEWNEPNDNIHKNG